MIRPYLLASLLILLTTADNLSWFADTPSPAHPNGLPLNTPKHHRTIEDLMREKGEEVTIVDGGFMGQTWTVEGKVE